MPNQDQIKTAMHSINATIQTQDLWNDSAPNIVWTTYNERKRTKADTIASTFGPFFDHVRSVVNARIIANTHSDHPDGNWLCYAPDLALFEDVTRDLMPNFFGAGDCPPPAFWTHVNEDKLWSFIPKRFVPTATKGVALCVNGTLTWATL